MEKVKYIISIALLLLGFNNHSATADIGFFAHHDDSTKIKPHDKDQYAVPFENSISIHLMEELTEFTVVKNEDRVQIKWVVAGICDHSDFIIEKSKDGKKFKKLADVACTAASGDYAEFFETDYNPATFYRIKQLASDHEYKYSPVVPVKADEFSSKHGDENSFSTKLTENYEKPVLIVVRDKNGNEYASKVSIFIEEGKITGQDSAKTIPPGEYQIIASKIDVVDRQRIVIK